MKFWMCHKRMSMAALLVLPLGLGCQDQSTGGPMDGSVMPPNGGDEPAMALTTEELMDPKACKDCHPKHYKEWASSMHAYSTKDPIFRAMNARGQEETNNELGEFCVNCHAPLATRLNLVSTASDEELDALDPEFASVNCYFCHNVAGFVENPDPNAPPSNNPLQLAMDDVMRGGLKDPVKPPAHDVAYSPLMDGDLLDSSDMCGPCHDIVTPLGFHLEQTYAEWKTTVFADPKKSPANQSSCTRCHMNGIQGLAAETNTVQVGSRLIHEHLFVGLDVALTDDHPDRDAQMRAIECAVRNSSLSITKLLPGLDGSLLITTETDVGHAFPSGATQDRRVWLDIKIVDRMGNERRIGLVPDGMSVVDAAELPENGDMKTFFHELLDADGNVTHDFWEGVDRRGGLVKPPSEGDHAVLNMLKLFELGAPEPFWPARIEVTAYARPLGYDVVEDLLETGHLKDPTVIDKIPTFLLDSVYWDMEIHEMNQEVRATDLKPPDCPEQYRCLLYPEREGCSPR